MENRIFVLQDAANAVNNMYTIDEMTTLLRPDDNKDTPDSRPLLT